jgi:hypothetical protein
MRNFREALRLPGWSDQSIWGYDEQMDTYFAQLWRDGDTNDDPTVWISGCDPIGTDRQLADLIASATDVNVSRAMRAMRRGPRERSS